MAGIHCSCGALLAESLDEDEVTVDSGEFRFARSTDYIACPACEYLHKVEDLRAGDVGGHAPADEALAVLRDLSMDDPAEDDPARIVGRAPADD